VACASLNSLKADMNETITVQQVEVPHEYTEPPTFERVLAHTANGVLVGLGFALIATVALIPVAVFSELPWQWLAYLAIGIGIIACSYTWIIEITKPRSGLNEVIADMKLESVVKDIALKNAADNAKLREDYVRRLELEANQNDYRARNAARTPNIKMREDLYDTPARRDAKRMLQLYYQQAETPRKSPSREFMRLHEHNWTDKRHADAYGLLKDCGWIVANNKGNPQYPYQDPQEGYAALSSWLHESVETT
jgi:hypothetical protein